MSVEKPHVLVVDDNEATITLLTALLQRDYAVEAARDGADAIEKLRTKNYGAALIDLRMPPPDGFDVLEFLLEKNPAMLSRVIVVTASLAKGDVDRAKAYGVCAVISKPFEIDTVLAAVRQCAGPTDPLPLGGVFSSGVLFLLADLLRTRF